MSFILDALKKSEQERQRAATPGTVGLSYGHTRHGKPWWLMLALALLGLNCLLLLGMWLRNDNPAPATNTDATHAASSSTSATAAAIPPATVATTRGEVRALDSEVLEATEAEDSTSLLLSEAGVPDGPALVKPATDAANQTVINNYPVMSGASGNVPTLASLGGSAALNLPELRLDLHVYAPNKAERFVFINSKKYSEGQTLSEGPVLESITEDGVVLNYQGQRFSAPRQ